jgi:hypothetical protein
MIVNEFVSQLITLPELLGEYVQRRKQSYHCGSFYELSEGLLTPASPGGRCGNVAAILELDENFNKNFKVFEAAPQELRGVPAKKAAPDYFL